MAKKIFISAVSRELLRYRKLVALSLQKRGYEPVFQDTFNLSDEEIVAMLKGKLGECEACICLIGHRYGAEPSKPVDGFPRHSFTQLELVFGRAQVPPIPVLLLLTTEQTPIDHPNDELDDLKKLQSDFRANVTRDRNWRSFSSEVELRAEIAELRFPWEANAERKPCNLPPSIGTLFKGRDPFLAQVREKLEAGARAAITARQAIHGAGGIGKTQLAIEYGWRHFDDYQALLYVFAESPEILLKNLSQLAGVLELPEKDLADDGKRADAVLRWLNEHTDWLLLIDNVDNETAQQAVVDRLKHVHGGHIIITCRVSRWPAHFEPLELDVLDSKDAVAFLLEAAHNRARSPLSPGGRGAGGEGDDDAAQAGYIAHDAGYLALALTQAAGYIDKYRISFAEYRRRWEANVGKVAAWHDPKTMRYPRSLAVAWNTTVDHLTPAAKILLECLSYLSHEPIPRDLITGETSAQPLADARVPNPEEALVELADVSLAKLTGDSVVLHRLVQEMTRQRVAEGEREGRLKTMLQTLGTYGGSYWLDLARWWLIQTHVEVILEWSKTVKNSEAYKVFVSAQKQHLVYRGLKEKFEHVLRGMIETHELLRGPNDPEVARCLRMLAKLLKDLNRPDEAEPLLLRALSIDEMAALLGKK